MSPTLPKSIDNFDYLDWESFKPFFDELSSREISAETQRQWIEDYSNVTKLAQEAFAYTYIQKTLDTNNKENEAAFVTMVKKVRPELELANKKLKDRLLEMDIEDDDMQLMLRNLRAEVSIFSEANLKLTSEETLLSTRYDKIVGGLSAEFDGVDENLNMLADHMTSRDRSERERAWHTIMGCWQSVRSEINAIYVELVEKRQLMAENVGLANQREYAFIGRKRFAYGPDECFQFHDAIEAAFVPAAQRIIEQKREKLGYSSIRPWDWAPDLSKVVDASEGQPLEPFETEEELIKKSLNVFNALDPHLGHNFATMADNNLLDLMTRPGKAMGGYCYGLPLREKPFIFMNSVGSPQNVNTMLHEAGHAFHGFAAMDKQPLVWMQRAPMEFNEVASMAMELLASPYIGEEFGGFYNEEEAAHHRREHFEKIVLFMPYMAVVDSFQHWVYTNVSLAKDPANLDAKWDELWQRFLPGIDDADFPEERMSGWHRKLHIFRYPFYYIEYGMAQIGALQIWRNSLDNPTKALEDYRNALALGGTKDLPTLFAAAGAEFRFDTPFITDLVDQIPV